MNSHKPLIYILPGDTDQFNDLIIHEINSAESEFKKGRIDAAIDAAIYVSERTSMFRFGHNLDVWLLEKFRKSLKSKVEGSLEDKQAEEQQLEKLLRELKINAQDWIGFVEKIAFSKIPDDIRFPPGHPLPRNLYSVHPLSKKQDTYIPYELFDSILYEERESELIRLLVDLGATSIQIEDHSDRKLSAEVGAEVGLQGAGGVEGSTEGNNEELRSQSRFIKLKPKYWDSAKFSEDNNTDTEDNNTEEKYNWLRYEPTWETLVHSRCNGKCISYSIELKSDVSYSIAANLGLSEGLIANIGNISGKARLSNLYSIKKLFKVEFIDD